VLQKSIAALRSRSGKSWQQIARNPARPIRGSVVPRGCYADPQMAQEPDGTKTAAMSSFLRLILFVLLLLPMGSAAASPTRVDEQVRAVKPT
jgi:hypothetical protein